MKGEVNDKSEVWDSACFELLSSAATPPSYSSVAVDDLMTARWGVRLGGFRRAAPYEPSENPLLVENVNLHQHFPPERIPRGRFLHRRRSSWSRGLGGSAGSGGDRGHVPRPASGEGFPPAPRKAFAELRDGRGRFYFRKSAGLAASAGAGVSRRWSLHGSARCPVLRRARLPAEPRATGCASSAGSSESLKRFEFRRGRLALSSGGPKTVLRNIPICLSRSKHFSALPPPGAGHPSGDARVAGSAEGTAAWQRLRPPCPRRPW